MQNATHNGTADREGEAEGNRWSEFAREQSEALVEPDNWTAEVLRDDAGVASGVVFKHVSGALLRVTPCGDDGVNINAKDADDDIEERVLSSRMDYTVTFSYARCYAKFSMNRLDMHGEPLVQ